MRPQLPLPPSPSPLADRYTQRQPYLQPRVMGPTPYLARHSGGQEPPPPGSMPPHGYPRTLPAGVGPHLLPLPSGYSGRGAGGGGAPPPNGGYGVGPTGPPVSSRPPLVLAMPPSQSLSDSSQASRGTTQLRHYPSSAPAPGLPPPRTSNPSPSTSIMSGSLVSPAMRQQQQMAASSLSYRTTRAPQEHIPAPPKTSLPSNTVTQTSDKPSAAGSTHLQQHSVRTAPAGVTIQQSSLRQGGSGGGAPTTEDDLQRPALTVVPTSMAPVDKDLEVMTQGLKFQQQEWLEKPELKKVYAEVVHVAGLLQCLRAITTTPGHSADQEELIRTLHELLLQKLPHSIDRLQKRTTASVEVLEVNLKDVDSYTEDVTQRLRTNENMRTVVLAAAEHDLRRAKRRRHYQEQYEKLAGEIVAKKPRSACHKELETETAKLDEAKKELARWKRLSDVRKSQTESALTYVRHLLSSITNPSALFGVLDAAALAESDSTIITTDHQESCAMVDVGPADWSPAHEQHPSPVMNTTSVATCRDEG